MTQARERCTRAPAIVPCAAAPRARRLLPGSACRARICAGWQGRPVSYASSEHGTRSFCPRCGTQLMFEDDRSPDEVDLTTCSLDESDRFPPKSHIYTATKVAWVKLDDGLPRYDASSRSD